MKIYSLLSIFLIIIFLSCQKEVQINGIYVDFDKIEKVKNDLKKGEQKYTRAYNILIQKAESALNEGPFSVMDKKRTPPSGDKHDYLSMGPYWWPDPKKTDGLPYIRRDGEVNPETRGDNVDRTSAAKLFSNIETLGWAFYFSDEKKYAEKAIKLIETWFINPETLMNPNLEYAQGIPGRTEGRGIGIIDWSGINRLITPFQILEATGYLQNETKTQLHNWFEEYHNWLVSSKKGIDEDDYFNNHGTWYDVQVVGIELMLGKTKLAKTRLEQVKNKRIALQIEPDGSQPHELERTKSLGYSTMNLRGFIHLAKMGEKKNVDLWNFETQDGRSIKKALNFLLPVAQSKNKWTYQQLGHLDDAIETLKINFQMAGSLFNEPDYVTVAKSIKNTENNIETLLYPF
ncbi:alginate lyase family protein [Maribellus maritimus]|uniref:alginate lyase family protein n=1 Tax=Maribellus maritimus TaxID=2870838 RepID=UPI001EE9B942|nr:alginate lyase family protein [Maribellus maritimus]MCG6186211.1 alginate lyase family protein [Maribellus maritimus]